MIFPLAVHAVPRDQQDVVDGPGRREVGADSMPPGIRLPSATRSQAVPAQQMAAAIATPGTESHDKLALLTVLGADTFGGSTDHR